MWVHVGAEIVVLELKHNIYPSTLPNPCVMASVVEEVYQLYLQYMISTEYIMLTKMMYPCIRKSLDHWLAGKNPLSNLHTK